MPQTHTPAAADAAFSALGGDESVIPDGAYCYTSQGWSETTDGLAVMHIKLCPYWARDLERPEQDNGYCAKLKSGDWEDGWGILWDQVKACGVRDDISDEEEKEA